MQEQEYQRITSEDVFVVSRSRLQPPMVIVQICSVMYLLASISSIAGYLYYIKHYNNQGNIILGSEIWIAIIITILLLFTICSAILCAINFKGQQVRPIRHVTFNL